MLVNNKNDLNSFNHSSKNDYNNNYYGYNATMQNYLNNKNLTENIIIYQENPNNYMTNMMNNSSNNSRNINHNQANDNSIDEYNKNEVNESIYESELNDSGSDAKSVISSNILSHIYTPKMLTGLRSDMSFISYQSKSDKDSRIDTLNNNFLFGNNNNLNIPYSHTNNNIIITNNDQSKNNHIYSIMNETENTNNPNNYINNNFSNNQFVKLRNSDYYGDDQEFEMLNENYEGYKYLETPKSSIQTNTNVNNLNSNLNNCYNNVTTSLNNNNSGTNFPTKINVHNNTNDKNQGYSNNEINKPNFPTMVN